MNKISVGQAVMVESRRGQPPYKATVVRVDGPMVLVEDEDGGVRLVPLKDVTPRE